MDPLQYYDLHLKKQTEAASSSALNPAAPLQNVPAIASEEEFPLPDIQKIGEPVDPVTNDIVKRKVCDLLQFGTVERFPGAQPVSFDESHIELLLTHDYFVCEKSDGIRYLMLALMTDIGPRCFLIDRKNQVRMVKVYLPCPSNTRGYHHETLFDGELVLDVYKKSQQTRLRFLVFDIMAVNSQPIIDKSLSYRLGKLQSDVMKHYSQKLLENPDDVLKQHFEVRMKDMQRSYASKFILEEQVPKLHHGNDGLIYTPVHMGYICGTCESLLKWKPANLSTVDFKIRAQKTHDGKYSYMLQLLTRKDTHEDFFRFVPDAELALKWRSLNPDPNMRIAEFKYDSNSADASYGHNGSSQETGQWRFLRFRDDKFTANHVTVYDKIMHSLEHAATKEQLYEVMPKVKENWKEREKLPAPQVVTATTVAKKPTPIQTDFVSFKYDFTHPVHSIFMPSPLDSLTEASILNQAFLSRPIFKLRL